MFSFLFLRKGRKVRLWITGVILHERNSYKSYYTNLYLPLVFFMYLYSHTLVFLTTQNSFPSSCHFSPNWFPFLKSLCIPPSFPVPLEFSFHFCEVPEYASEIILFLLLIYLPKRKRRKGCALGCCLKVFKFSICPHSLLWGEIKLLSSSPRDC
jgi:hypothetical protein